MTFMERIERMNPAMLIERPEIRAFWDKSLCWTLAHRRAFKHFLGNRLPQDDFFNYQTDKEPIHLSEVELAILCWAGAGTSGLIRNDRSFSQNAAAHPWFEGRVYPSACNVWFAHLLFTNDEGVFLYRPHVPKKIVEINTVEDMAVIFKAFKEGVVQLSGEPIWKTEEAVFNKQKRSTSSKSPTGLEKMFQPGVTCFFPLVDITVEAINILFMLHGTGTRLFDEEAGKLTGVKEWVDRGLLNVKEVPLRLFESGVIQILIAHQYYIHQNLLLAATALGLGAYVTGGGYDSLMCLHECMEKGGRGFRFASDAQGFKYPVGIDGIIETHMPPYMSMDEAVQDVYDMKFKRGYGRYSAEVKEGAEVMYPGFDPHPRAVHRPFLEAEKYTRAARVDPVESLEIAKCVANYIYDNYGRFPKLFNPILCESFVQVSHIDLEFYEQYQVAGSIWKEQKEHLQVWHGRDA